MPRYSTKLKSKPKPKNSLQPLWLSLAGLVIIVIAAWAMISNNKPANASIEVKGEPRLKVEKTQVDHGDIKLGTPVRDDIRVTNVGDQPLRFEEAPYIEVKEGC